MVAKALNGTIKSPTKQTAKDFLYYIPSQVVPALLGMIGIPIFTRLLSPEQFGQVVLVTLTVSVCYNVFFIWLSHSAVRYYSQFKEDRYSEYISTLIFALLAISGLVSLIWYGSVIVFEKHLSAELRHLFVAGILLMLTTAGYFLTLAMTRAGRERTRFSLYCCVEAFVKLVFACMLLYYFSWGPESIIWGAIIATGGTFIWDQIRHIRKRVLNPFSFSLKIFKQFVKYGLPLMGMTAGLMLISISDRYLIGYFLGANAVGLYSAGGRVAEISLQPVFILLMVAAAPILVITWEKEGEKRASDLLRNLISIYILVLLPITIGVICLSKDIIKIVLGPQFFEAYKIMPWVVVGVFSFGLSQYTSKPFEFKENTLTLLYVGIGAAVFEIGMNIIFLPRYGYISAAVSSCATYSLYLLISLVLSKRVMGWHFPWGTLWKSLTAALIMYLLLIVTPIAFHMPVISLITKIVFGALVYTICLFAVREKVFLHIVWQIRSSSVLNNIIHGKIK